MILAGPSRSATNRKVAKSIVDDVQRLEGSIRTFRGVQVILDSDLAAAYGVPTRGLNQAVRRNRARFPADFVFRLDHQKWLSLRSQNVISKPGRGGRRHSAWAFTEHGAVMAASILSSSRAVDMSVFVVRAFVRLRDLARGHAALAANLAALERKVVGHDHELKAVFATLRALIEPPRKARRTIGFHRK